MLSRMVAASSPASYTWNSSFWGSGGPVKMEQVSAKDTVMPPGPLVISSARSRFQPVSSAIPAIMASAGTRPCSSSSPS